MVCWVYIQNNYFRNQPPQKILHFRLLKLFLFGKMIILLEKVQEFGDLIFSTSFFILTVSTC